MKTCNYINGKIIKYIEAKNEYLTEEKPYIEWLIGGRGGGSCWNDNPVHYNLEPDEKPEFKVMDQILEIISPNISYLQYRELLNAGIIKYSEKYYNEYYGNHTEYAREEFSLNELITYLLKNNLIIEEALKG